LASREIKTVLYKGRRIPVSKYLEEERQSLWHEVELFQREFSRLEHALGELLRALLGATNSKIPYAIYYSVTGFETRVRIVGNALIEATTENSKLRLLQKDKYWSFLSRKIGAIRTLRNDIAHGSLQTLLIGDKPYVRWAPPSSDVIRILRRIAKQQVPGISAEEMLKRRAIVWPVTECIDDLTSIVRASRGTNPALRDRYRELGRHLRALRNLISGVPQRAVP
jgi:hypothetical protein